MSYSKEQVRGLLLKLADMIDENKQMLTDLDAAIGDGDHGHNMARGFDAARVKLAQGPAEQDAEAMLKATAMALISNVGGAAGPLYGTLFLKGAATVKGKEELGLPDLADFLKAGIEGVQLRGKAILGEKTMLDVLIPVQAAIAADAEAGEPAVQSLEKAAALARACAEKTKEIVATKGRASYLGERSIGHIDPGAMSSCLMIEKLAGLVKGG